jgi:hypothetical protein
MLAYHLLRRAHKLDGNPIAGASDRWDECGPGAT